MNNICNLETITFTDPFNRWFWEAFCGRGGTWMVIVAFVVILIFIIAKAKE